MVADGVGGWGELDVCSGVFSRHLTSTVGQLYNNISDKSQMPDLKELLIAAVRLNPNQGSSTAVMALLGEEGRLQTCNLGDSAYLILRPDMKDREIEYKKVYRSKEQTYSFNFPYQCGTNCELPHDAIGLCHELKHNDIVVMGSDGLFDNLFDDDIKNCIVKHTLHGQTNIERAADCIAVYAEFVSYKKDYVSPFTKSAIEHGLPEKDNLGGKEDDITVIVAQAKFY